MKPLRFLNIIFANLPGGKSTGPGEFNFFIYFAAEIFEFSFRRRYKIGWPPGHLGRVYKTSKNFS